MTMKKTLALLLSAVLLWGLFGCSAPIIYEEEIAAVQWLNERTEGYTALPPNQTRLYKDEEGFIFHIRSASGGIPRPEIEYDPLSVTVRETDLLTSFVGDTPFATASTLNRVFHPYQNQYNSAMQIFWKDAKTFRVFLWLYAEDTDDYPLPRILNAEQYQSMLELVNAYNDEMYVKHENEGALHVNYVQIFLDSYPGKYISDKVSNPEGVIFYEYNGGAKDYVSEYSSLFAKLNMTQQDWRASYEALGYKGAKPVYQILYFDVAIGNTVIDLTLNTADVYTSPALQEKNLTFTYTFCPELAKQEFMNVTQK